MSQLDQTIEVNISRETSAVARTAFNIPLFAAAHTAFSERTKEYTSLPSVAADFSSTSNVYKAAVQVFGQERRPPKMVVGRKQVNSVSCSISSVVVGSTYTLIINGLTVSYVAQSGATQQSIIDGLEAAFGVVGVAGIIFTDNTGSFTVAPSVTNTGWSFKATANVAVTPATSTETWPDALSAMRAASSAFYGLTTEDHSDVSILAIAAWANASNVLYGASTQSSTVPTSATNDIASQLQALAYTRVFLLYSPTADSQFPECAWMGDRLPPVAGSAQWVNAQLQGVTAGYLTDSQIGYLEAKKCNYYITIAGVSVTKQGWVSSGQFIEETMMVDWTKSRIQELLMFRMVNSLKLPSDNAGLAIIQSDINTVLQEGVRNGGFAKSPAPSVYVPDILDIDPNLRAQGIVSGIKFKARLVVSITKVIIDGTVTI
jgi:hypothetical protein